MDTNVLYLIIVLQDDYISFEFVRGICIKGGKWQLKTLQQDEITIRAFKVILFYLRNPSQQASVNLNDGDRTE